MTMQDVALSCIDRGWYVFPCVPRGKRPLTKNGYKDASNDHYDVLTWWAKTPDANVGIATGASGLCVVDVDHGAAEDTMLRIGDDFLPATYKVRTGRRPEYGVQLYYSGTGLKSTGWVNDGLSGDIRCATGYVMAAGSIHPSGEAYTVLYDVPLTPVPEFVRTLTSKVDVFDPATSVSNEVAEEWKTWLYEYAGFHKLDLRGYEKRVVNGWWFGVECPWVSQHKSGAGAESSTVVGVLDGKLVFECSHSSCKVNRIDTDTFKSAMLSQHGDWIAEPGADPVVFISKPVKTDRGDADEFRFFDTPDQILNAEPVDFLIKDIIPKNRYTGIVALSGSRKTIVACNLVRAALTGEPFLNHFPVDTKPERVLLFAAESARSELRDRIGKMGLGDYLQSRKLLVRSAATMGDFHQDQLPASLLAGSLCIFDTFIRFFDGASEQDSTEARKFSAQMQRVVNAGATVIVLFHAPKGARAAGVDEMTVETVRGSSELGAAMACCWGLAMLGANWTDNTRMAQVKRREFECTPPVFDFSCDMDTAICTYVDAVTVKIGGGANRAAEDEISVEYMEDHPEMSDRELSAGCEGDTGVKRSYRWFQRKRKSSKG